MRVSIHDAYDEQLWRAFLKGDQKAYAEIYRIYFSILYEYGVRLCKNADLVKDCIQDLFVKLWINRENLHATNTVSLYLYAALRGTILNKLDQKDRRVKREVCAFKINSFDVNYTTIEDSLISLDQQAERNRQVLKALNSLTSRQKECVFLRFYAGLEYTEIADIMEISVKASYKIVGRALEVMRKHFREIAAYSLLSLIYLSTIALSLSVI